jgi:putative ABC transport system ATP-binding protein
MPRLSALENVALPLVYAGVRKEERLDRARQVLESVGLGDRVGHKPNELSGGQRQRVAVARALVNNPAIILADEPTGNLDSVNGLEVMNLLTQLNQAGTTVIMVTHSTHDSGFAHRVVNLFDGKVVTEQFH